jgi:hypothetical protein
MPAVTAVVLTDSATITFTGTGFFATGYDGSASFNGIWADTVTITDATTVVAKWTKGVPTIAAEAAPQLRFTKKATGGRRLLTATDSPLQHYATNTVKLGNVLSVTGSTSGLECSFAGGCNYEVNAKGLSTLLKDAKNNYVSVCDQPCVYNDAASTSDKAVCVVPQISTTYSDSNFKIAKSQDNLNSGVFFGSKQDTAKNAFDGNLLNNAGDDSADCHIGMSFKEKHIGLIS